MRLAQVLFAVSLITGSFGCGGEHEEVYDSFQDCFDDHVGAEALPVDEAIVICALDHPETGGSDLPDAEACVDFVDQNLDEESATLEEIEDACDEYVIQKDA